MTDAELLTLAGELGFDRAAVLDTGEIPKLLPTFGQTFDLDKLFP